MSHLARELDRRTAYLRHLVDNLVSDVNDLGRLVDNRRVDEGWDEEQVTAIRNAIGDFGDDAERYIAQAQDMVRRLNNGLKDALA